MSYILDALQRADAERARGGVPGLHARQVAATALPKSGVARPGNWWRMAGVAVLAAVGTGFWLTRGPAVATPPAVADTLTPREVVVATPAANPTPAPVSVAVPVSASAPAPVLTPTPAAPPVLDAQANKPRTAPPAPTPVQPATAAVKPTAVAVVATSRASATAAAPATAIPWLADLPQDLRQSIPKLTITGTVYSENPAQRILVVNGQVLTQGSEISPELTLAEIHPTNSDFIFRGTRFRMPH